MTHHIKIVLFLREMESTSSASANPESAASDIIEAVENLHMSDTTSATEGDTTSNTTTTTDATTISDASVKLSLRSPSEIAAEILELTRDARFLAAKEVWDANSAALSEIQDASMKAELELAHKRVQEVTVALQDQELTSDWTHAISYFGIDTHYQYRQGSREMSIRMEGTLQGVPLFEQAAVVHEVDLWTDWIPFVTHAKTVEKVSHGEIIA